MTNLNPWQSAGLAEVLHLGSNQGNIFYVDGTGPDTNDGLSIDTPLASITAALALCTNLMQDTIVILDYWAAGTETWPIDCNKQFVTIAGVMGAGAMWPQVNPPGDTAAFNITAMGTHITGLSINGGATHGAIELGASVWGIVVSNCWFGEAGTAQDGIRDVATFDAVYAQIYGCRFGAGLTRNGVRVDHNMTRGFIGMLGKAPNLFRQVVGVAIYVNNTMAQGFIQNNIISLPSNTAGMAITLDATCVTNTTVTHNYANFGDTDMGNNPYLDSAAGGSNNWILNYQGTTAVQPA